MLLQGSTTCDGECFAHVPRSAGREIELFRSDGHDPSSRCGIDWLERWKFHKPDVSPFLRVLDSM
jgi:hypothetical protein